MSKGRSVLLSCILTGRPHPATSISAPRAMRRRMKADVASSRVTRALLMAAGSLLVALGAVGIFVPLLPTTPFLLLAAYCFLRSSERLHAWLLSNRLLGSYIRGYQDGSGIPLVAKAATLALLWATIAVSAVLFVDALLVRVVLLVVAVAVSAHVLTLRTLR